jgi:hypothetical protein
MPLVRTDETVSYNKSRAGVIITAVDSFIVVEMTTEWEARVCELH